ncbi:MAG: HigA family addiction module antitoxin [Bryobacteraceae bacterium]
MPTTSKSSTTTKKSAPPRRLPPIHPGEVLHEVLREAKLTANALGLALRVPANRIGAIVKGQRGITADTALRLARYFNTSPQMWMNLQAKYDLAVAQNSLSRLIEREVSPREAA